MKIILVRSESLFWHIRSCKTNRLMADLCCLTTLENGIYGWSFDIYHVLWYLKVQTESSFTLSFSIISTSHDPTFEAVQMMTLMDLVNILFS
jgi:hypothetical protein